MLNVKITYPDKTYSVRSFEDQVDHIIEETVPWKAWFYWTLLYKKEPVPSRFGTYELTNEPVTENE